MGFFLFSAVLKCSIYIHEISSVMQYLNYSDLPINRSDSDGATATVPASSVLEISHTKLMYTTLLSLFIITLIFPFAPLYYHPLPLPPSLPPSLLYPLGVPSNLYGPSSRGGCLTVMWGVSAERSRASCLCKFHLFVGLFIY
jgi:hypothetical protein